MYIGVYNYIYKYIVFHDFKTFHVLLKDSVYPLKKLNSQFENVITKWQMPGV